MKHPSDNKRLGFKTKQQESQGFKQKQTQTTELMQQKNRKNLFNPYYSD